MCRTFLAPGCDTAPYEKNPGHASKNLLNLNSIWVTKEKKLAVSANMKILHILVLMIIGCILFQLFYWNIINCFIQLSN